LRDERCTWNIQNFEKRQRSQIKHARRGNQVAIKRKIESVQLSSKGNLRITAIKRTFWWTAFDCAPSSYGVGEFYSSVSVSEDQDAMVLTSMAHHCRVVLCGGGGWSWMSHWHFLWYEAEVIVPGGIGQRGSK
jgi:hypothetical protein